MTAPPNHPNEGLTAIAPVEITIRQGDAEGNAPSETDDVEHLRLLRITRYAGGREYDRATFAYDLDKTGQRLVDLETVEAWNREIEVRGVGDSGDPNGDALFWGDLGSSTLSIGPYQEGATVEAVLAPYLFGDLIYGPKVRNPLNEETEVFDYDVDIVFNPLIDGKIVGNMSDLKDADDKYKVWLHPDSIATEESREFQNVEPEEWTLDEAVNSLLWAFNSDETFIKNFDALSGSIFDDAPPLRNVRIPRGIYLPQALDLLLQPFGFDWFVDFTLEDTNDPGDGSDHEASWEMNKSIVVFKRSQGVEKELRFQRPGEYFVPGESNVPLVGVSWDIVDLANTVEAYGSFEEREVTIELHKAWSDASDTLTADDCDTQEPTSAYYLIPDNRRVHRMWVANEAGDWNGIRENMPDPPDLSEVFTDYVPKRRRLYECLVYNDTYNKRRIPVELEWWNPKNPNDEKWEKVPSSWGFVVLSDQIGIRFTGQKPPADLVEAGDEARLRATGTLIGDRRLTTLSTTSGNSPNSRDVMLYLDVSDRFHDRKPQEDGNFKSKWWDDDFEFFAGESFDIADDLSELQDYVDELATVEESATIDADLVLHGIHFDYNIGDVITKIDGRNISFNRNAPNSSSKIYLQVQGIVLDYQQQQTILKVEAQEADV